MSPRRLPPLPSGPLTLGAARTLGLADHDWRLAELSRVTQTVRATEEPSCVAERARAFSLALPADCVFSHVTAARLWGFPLPRDVEGDPRLDVIRSSDRPRIERRGCRSHRGLETRSSVVLNGLRVTGLADTWVDLGDRAQHPLSRNDLVVAGDAAVSRAYPAQTPRPPEVVEAAVEPLRAALATRIRPRGGVDLARAAQLVRPGVRSPMESRSRLMFVDAGLPEPEINAPVTARDGGWLAEGDLVWRRARVVAEYQGEVHAPIRARSADAYRAGLVGDEGWTVVELFAEDVHPGHRRRAVLLRTARLLGIRPSTLTLG